MNALEQRLEDIKTPLDVAVIGCIVNGPGEAKEADLGITGGTPANLVYQDGRPNRKLNNADLIDQFEQMIRQKVAEKEAAEAAIIVRSTATHRDD
jgi:(E)-4-hydroxy-3-methylbut-2-enyl-diphosphate synthase